MYFLFFLYIKCFVLTVIIKSPLLIISDKAVTNIKFPYQVYPSILIISQNAKFTLLNHNKKYNLNSTKLNITIKNQSIICEKNEDLVSIDSINFNFEYYTIIKRSKMNFINNALALSYNNNENKDFLSQLKNNKIIQKKIYGFEYELTEEKQGNFYIGEIPKILTMRKYKVKCPIIINNKTERWGCKINKIYFENFEYKTFDNEIITFGIERSKMKIPKKILLFINETVFIKYYKSGDCFYKNILSRKTIFCNENIINKLPKINFEFLNFSLIFNLDILFVTTIKKNNSNFFLKLNIEINNEDENEWVLGWKFLKSYITKFDYDKGIITFYNNEPFLSIKLKQIHIQINFYLKILLYLMVLSILFELFIIIKFKI